MTSKSTKRPMWKGGKFKVLFSFLQSFENFSFRKKLTAQLPLNLDRYLWKTWQKCINQCNFTQNQGSTLVCDRPETKRYLIKKKKNCVLWIRLLKIAILTLYVLKSFVNVRDAQNLNPRWFILKFCSTGISRFRLQLKNKNKKLRLSTASHSGQTYGL